MRDIETFRDDFWESMGCSTKRNDGDPEPVFGEASCLPKPEPVLEEGVKIALEDGLYFQSLGGAISSTINAQTYDCESLIFTIENNIVKMVKPFAFQKVCRACSFKYVFRGEEKVGKFSRFHFIERWGKEFRFFLMDNKYPVSEIVPVLIEPGLA